MVGGEVGDTVLRGRRVRRGKDASRSGHAPEQHGEVEVVPGVEQDLVVGLEVQLCLEAVRDLLDVGLGLRETVVPGGRVGVEELR